MLLFQPAFNESDGVASAKLKEEGVRGALGSGDGGVEPGAKELVGGKGGAKRSNPRRCAVDVLPACASPSSPPPRFVLYDMSFSQLHSPSFFFV